MSIAQPLPDLELPPALSKAEQVRVDRAADLAQAQEALRAARIAVETAIIEDRALYASARDEGRDDPGPMNERAARADVEQAQRRLAGEELRLATAEDALAAAAVEHVDAWAEQLSVLWGKADREVLRALAKLQQTEARHAEIRSVAVWVLEVQASGDLGARRRPVSEETSLRDAVNVNAHLRVEQLLAALQEHVEETSAESFGEGAPERVALRERDRRRAALLSSPQRAVRVAATLLDAGELNLSEAEGVAAGESLEAVEERARIRRARERSAPVIIG